LGIIFSPNIPILHLVSPADCEHLNSPVIVEGIKTKFGVVNTESISLRYFHLDEAYDSSYFYYSTMEDALQLLTPLIIARNGLCKKKVKK